MTDHKSGKEVLPYELRFLERTLTLHVFKNGQFAYEARWTGRSFSCSCPSGKIRHYCWHLDGDIKKGGSYEGISQVLAQPSCTEPWCEWAEEAQEMMEEKR